jgi:chromosome segregation ATPase
MARDQKVRVRIQATDEASGKIKKTQSSLQRLGGFIKNNFAASMLSATAVIYGFVRALTATIKASAEQELAVRKLDAALSPLGDKAAAISKELQEYAAALQQVTSYGDETIIAGQALIASFTKNTEEIKGATQAALDLASATGQSLQSAFLLLGRAAAGETSMLSRYGITLDENTPKSEKFAAALVKINEQFGGQAVAQAKTFTGQMAQLGNAFGDLQEAIGDSFTQSKRATGALRSLTELIQGLIPLARRAGDAFTILGNVLWKLAIPYRVVARVTAELTDLFLKLSGSTDVVDASMDALDATANRYGATTAELVKHIEKLERTTPELVKETDKLGDSLEDDASAMLSFVDGLVKMEKVTPAATTSLQAFDEAANALTVEARGARREVERLEQTVASAGATAAFTAAQFDALAASQGRTAATAAGGQVVMAGRRVRFRGGSRLTSEPGFGGKFFSPEKRSYVTPGGGVVFL